MLTLWILKRHILAANRIFWAILHQNPLRIVVCSLNDEPEKKKHENCTFHPLGETLPLNRSQPNLAILFISPRLSIVQKFVLIGSVVSALERRKMCTLPLEQQVVLTTAAPPRLHIISTIRIADINNAICWYGKLVLSISTCTCNNTNCRYRQLILLHSCISDIGNWNCRYHWCTISTIPIVDISK